MRLFISVLFFSLVLVLGAVRRHLPPMLARGVMRLELPLAIQLRWRGSGVSSTVDDYMFSNRGAYAPALTEALFKHHNGSIEARMVWVPLIQFLTDKTVRDRVREYAEMHAGQEFRKEIEETLQEALKW